MENAFATPPQRDATHQIILHNQAWFGNGGETFAALVSEDIISHELAHLYTASTSDLQYFEQAGGINEAFSDITSIAFRDYLHEKYAWFNYSWSMDSPLLKMVNPCGILPNQR